MAKLLMVVAPRDFRDEEYFVPREILDQAGHEVLVGSLEKHAYSKKGKELIVEDLLEDLEVTDFQGIVMVGGSGGKVYLENQKVLGWIKEFHDKGLLVAAICMAPAILARAGILKGKKSTVHEHYKQEVIDGGAEYQKQGVVRDGNIITANGPEASEDFGKEIVSYFAR